MNHQLPERLRNMPPEIPYTPPELPPAQRTGDVLLMRVVGIVLIAGCLLAQAWVFMPFAVAYMFRDVFAESLYANTTPEQRAMIRFAQWRLMGSALASLYVVAIYQRGFFTVLVIFVIAWIDVILKLLAKPQASPTPPALPAPVTTAVTDRRSDRRIVRP